MDFTDQVAIVTGGSRGIGRAVVAALAQRGARVFFCYRERHDAAQQTLEQCADLRGEVAGRQADVRDSAAVGVLVEEVLERWQHVDVLINCAAVPGYGPVDDLSLDGWRALLETNLTGTYHTCRAVVRPMLCRRYGRIVNVAGLHGISGFPGLVGYCASMGGVLGLTRALAREVAPWQITVNAVAPGFVETDLLATFPSELRSWGVQTIAQRRAGRPEEVASAIVFLASTQASYITGQTLPVDGGWTMT